MKRTASLRSVVCTDSPSRSLFTRGGRAITTTAHKRSTDETLSRTNPFFRATGCASFYRRTNATSSIRLYTTAVQVADGKAAKKEIKEAISPLLLERRIKESFTLAEGNLEEQAWPTAEDRFHVVLENCEQLQAESGKNRLVTDDFLGAVRVRLAFAQHNQGKRDYAEQNYRTGIQLLKSSLGPEDLQVAYALVNLSEVLALLSKIDEAEKTAEEAIKLLEKKLGKDHELVGGTLANYAGFLCAQNKFREAVAPNMRALEILEKTLGADNEITSSALSNSLRIFDQLNDKEQLEKLRERYQTKYDQFIRMHKKTQDFSEEEVNKMKNDWEEEANKKVLDPQGMYKSKGMHREELKAFINVWKSESGKKLSSEELEVLTKELDGASDEELAGMAQYDPDKMAQLLKELRDAPPKKGAQPSFRTNEVDLSSYGVDALDLGEEGEGESSVTKIKAGKEEEFLYDDQKPAEPAKPVRGFTKPRPKQGARRVKKLGKTEEEGEGEIDDEEDNELWNRLKEAHEKAEGGGGNSFPFVVASDGSTPGPEVFKMLEEEERLTQKQFEREAHKRQQQAKTTKPTDKK